MNRLQSMVAAGLTTALSAGAVGAFASAQGLFESGTTQAAEETVTEAPTWSAPATVEIPVASASTPQVIYKDLEPIVVTRQVFTAADPSPSVEAAASPTESATPSPTSSPVVPASPTSASTPIPAPQAPPVFALAPEASPSASASGTFDDNGGNRAGNQDDDGWDDDDWDDDDHGDDQWDDHGDDDHGDDDRDHEDDDRDRDRGHDDEDEDDDD